MLNYLLYRTGEFVALYLPLAAGYRIAVFLSDLRYIFAAQDRKAVTENLKAIFPEKTKEEREQIQIRMFRNFAKYLVDFFRFSKINLEYIQRNIKIEGRNYVNEALSKGKGAIILSAHIGNWELGAIVVSLLGYPFLAVALPHKDKRVNEFFNAQRESKGVKVIPLGRAYRACINALKENKVVALAGDRDFSKEGGIVVKFFGRNAIFPEGPAALVRKLDSVIVPGFMTRNPDDTFTLRFEKPIHADGKEMMPLIDEYKAIIEKYIKEYPDQWYMFRRFWIS